MVYKLCAVCQKYFAGELNGSYICPGCRVRQQPQPAVPAAAASGAVHRPAAAPNSPRAA